ncbi:MAG: alpha-ribazole phosphatase [Nitrospirae bacterium CG_4_10_14_0_8_um_filter_41_23]|nr:alpha-ribazole phosphatase [Nitrospirota bacterium]OIP60862.1 MAG: alpha-ribazole phosphatase [Nitrospirae bacterium CG2_30_41_42]PIQ94679.1 MAG: alpha-ribazole phosphatase [Nitrospirae bacterium CG11_big_fil_rev_8_21_14_0_20_41_14]PIV42511.1 MAG: alpha-ribazole phosphatase [Nitrospirae bacterium CG02_land_8_20_14_3_00_41_53]PIW87972.1 MAG: alpha-ribazole phosphatase [Nitrospirae bacterium CG_4_8_14_3_um_filter_41_47]PIY87312.1 MAG: alpha-ribazole phosphatase [Nitrospirae bacterium CG_4_10_
MVTTLYLIRHGETEGSETKRYKGTIDVPLSKKGVMQMEQLLKYIVKEIKNCSNPPSPPLLKGGKGGLLSAVYCSDLSRAVKSAEIIARPHSLNPIIVPSLRERNFGLWEGMSFDEIREKYPIEFDAWAGNPLKFSPMGGESTMEMKERVIGAFDTIITNHKGENVAMIAHGGVNRIVLCHLMGVPLENIFRIEQDYGALNIVEFWDRYPVVKLINGIING